jgi:hypothetical protein
MDNNNNTQEWELNYMKRVRQVLSLVNDKIHRPMVDEVDDYDVLEYRPEGWQEIGGKWYSFVVRLTMGETLRKTRSDVPPKWVAWTFHKIDRTTLEREEVLACIVLPEWKLDDVMWDTNMLFTLMNEVIEDGTAYFTKSLAALPKKRLSPLDDVEEKLRSFVEAYKGLSKEGQRVFLEDHRHTLTTHPLDFKMWDGVSSEVEEYLHSIGYCDLHVWDSDSERFSEFIARTPTDLQASAGVLGYHCFNNHDADSCATAVNNVFSTGPQELLQALIEYGITLWDQNSHDIGQFLREEDISIVEVFDHMDSDDHYLWCTDGGIGEFLDRLWYDDRIRLSEVANWLYLRLDQEEN